VLVAIKNPGSNLVCAGANPTIASYNAWVAWRVVKTKKYYSTFKKRPSLLQRWIVVGLAPDCE
jgi:hypothetical protein